MEAPKEIRLVTIMFAKWIPSDKKYMESGVSKKVIRHNIPHDGDIHAYIIELHVTDIPKFRTALNDLHENWHLGDFICVPYDGCRETQIYVVALNRHFTTYFYKQTRLRIVLQAVGLCNAISNEMGLGEHFSGIDPLSDAMRLYNRVSSTEGMMARFIMTLQKVRPDILSEVGLFGLVKDICTRDHWFTSPDILRKLNFGVGIITRATSQPIIHDDASPPLKRVLDSSKGGESSDALRAVKKMAIEHIGCSHDDVENCKACQKRIVDCGEIIRLARNILMTSGS